MKELRYSDLKNLKVGQELRLAGGSLSFMTEKVFYMGIQDIFYTKKHLFVTGNIYKGKTLPCSVKDDGDNSIITLNHSYKLFLTYDDACEYERERMVRLIEHYNNHQFSKNPIKIMED